MKTDQAGIIKYKVQGIHGKEDQPDGVYTIPHAHINLHWFHCELHIADGWEHVAVRLFKIISQTKRASRPCDRYPTWMEMDYLRNQFWGPQEVVLQFHPAMESALAGQEFKSHLWNPTKAISVPDVLLKRGRTLQPALDWVKGRYPEESEQDVFDVVFLLNPLVDEWLTRERGGEKLGEFEKQVEKIFNPKSTL